MSNSPLTITHYSDPGHGWYRVQSWVIQALDLTDQISPYSYLSRKYVYLEEDADAALFFATLGERGIQPRIFTKHTNRPSNIRNYPAYSHQALLDLIG